MSQEDGSNVLSFEDEITNIHLINHPRTYNIRQFKEGDKNEIKLY